MKRLFSVKKSNGEVARWENGQLYLTATKKEAKSLRDGLNAVTKGHTVSLGPGHRNYKEHK